MLFSRILEGFWLEVGWLWTRPLLWEVLKQVGLAWEYNITRMATLIVELPTEVDAQEARLLLAIKLYETGKLSLGQAARLAGYTKPTFVELLGKHGVPVFAYSPEELREEVER